MSRPDAKSLIKKLERWQKIAASAAEQSGRGCIPQVRAAASYESAVKQAAAADYPLFFYENEQTRTLHQVFESAPTGTVSLMTGPEGGFTTEEVALAQQAGMAICSPWPPHPAMRDSPPVCPDGRDVCRRPNLKSYEYSPDGTDRYTERRTSLTCLLKSL